MTMIRFIVIIITGPIISIAALVEFIKNHYFVQMLHIFNRYLLGPRDRSTTIYKVQRGMLFVRSHTLVSARGTRLDIP